MTKLAMDWKSARGNETHPQRPPAILLLLTGILTGCAVFMVPRLTAALVFFLGGVVVFLWSWIAYRDWATPMNLFAIPWLFVLGLFHLELLNPDVQGSLEPFSYLIIVGSIFCFLVGCFIADFGRETSRSHIASEEKTISNSRWSFSRMRTVILVTFLVGLIVWGYLFWRIGGLRVFLTEPNAYRHGFLLPLIDDLYKFLFLSGFLGVYYLAAGNMRRQVSIAAIFVVSLVLIGSRLARSDLFLYLVVSFMIVHLTKRIRLRHIAAITFGMFLAFLAIQYYRGSQFEHELLYIKSGIARAPTSLPWLAAIYTYTIPNVRNVQIAIQNTVSLEWGRNLLYPIWSFTRTTALMGFERHDHAYWRELYGLGIFKPYLIDFYRDFGIFGATILPALIGFFSTRLYRKAKFQSRPSEILLYSLISYCLLFSFVSDFFNDSAIWLFTAMVFVVNRISTVRVRPPNILKTEP